MNHHLANSTPEEGPEGWKPGSLRDGSSKKTLLTESEVIELAIPRNGCAREPEGKAAPVGADPGPFPTDEVATKLIWLQLREITKR